MPTFPKYQALGIMRLTACTNLSTSSIVQKLALLFPCSSFLSSAFSRIFFKSRSLSTYDWASELNSEIHIRNAAWVLRVYKNSWRCYQWSVCLEPLQNNLIPKKTALSTCCRKPCGFWLWGRLATAIAKSQRKIHLTLTCISPPPFFLSFMIQYFSKQLTGRTWCRKNIVHYESRAMMLERRHISPKHRAGYKYLSFFGLLLPLSSTSF